MIPRIIHYCWFGGSPLPAEAEECLSSWHEHMPDWDYRLWNEDNFDVQSHPYAAEAYAMGKYAFVSDYVRLWTLEREGGVYLDTDVKVFRPFDNLLSFPAFAGFEGSKHKPMGTCVLATQAHGEWVSEMLHLYDGLHFIMPNGTPDLTTNVQRLTAHMTSNGLRQNGTEQDYRDLHLFPTTYFCPRQTTGEYLRTADTYCDHLGLGSWGGGKDWKTVVGRLLGSRVTTRLIKLKRKLLE
ncbi:MAG: glycosyl transferase [Bacteroidales bacterium]|nr:glycosyl transferase [Bacteroidales bacterium]